MVKEKSSNHKVSWFGPVAKHQAGNGLANRHQFKSASVLLCSDKLWSMDIYLNCNTACDNKEEHSNESSHHCLS